MQTTSCANSLRNYHFFFWPTTFYFSNTCSIFSCKISVLRTPPYRPRFAFCSSLEPPDRSARRISEVGFPPGSLSFKISIFGLR